MKVGVKDPSPPSPLRRRLLGLLASGAGLIGLDRAARAQALADDEPLFEPAHKVVFQLNRADPDYIDHILFSVGEMLRIHGDEVHVVVTAFGPGVHLLAKRPGRPVSQEARDRAGSLALYGVGMHVCGNTLASLGWTEDDVQDYAKVVRAGADDLMQLQEKGYAYIAW